MNRSSSELREEARRVLVAAAERMLAIGRPADADRLDDIKVEINGKLTRVAGKAMIARHTIILSNKILSNASPEQVENTVLHEAAHLLAPPTRYYVNGRQKRVVHGQAWKSMHRLLGGDGKRTHDMRTHGDHEVECDRCGQRLYLSKIRAAKMIRNGDEYLHRGCRGTLRLVNLAAAEAATAPRAPVKPRATRTGRLGGNQRAALGFIAAAGRWTPNSAWFVFSVSDTLRVMIALEAKGLVRRDPRGEVWTLTDAGARVLRDLR